MLFKSFYYDGVKSGSKIKADIKYKQGRRRVTKLQTKEIQ